MHFSGSDSPESWTTQSLEPWHDSVRSTQGPFSFHLHSLTRIPWGRLRVASMSGLDLQGLEHSPNESKRGPEIKSLEQCLGLFFILLLSTVKVDAKEKYWVTVFMTLFHDKLLRSFDFFYSPLMISLLQYPLSWTLDPQTHWLGSWHIPEAGQNQYGTHSSQRVPSHPVLHKQVYGSSQ